jgi:hypothetical protein
LPLAEADRVRLLAPEDIEDPRIPLLPVLPRDLGPELWRIDFEDYPRQLLNTAAGNYKQIGGHRKPGERARHIPDATNFLRYYRHLLAGPWRTYRTHRDDPGRARVVLCQPLHTPGDLVEQLASRQELVTNRRLPRRRYRALCRSRNASTQTRCRRQIARDCAPAG